MNTDLVFNFMENYLAPQLKEVPDDSLIRFIYNMTDDILSKKNFHQETQCFKQECSFCCYDNILLTPLEANHIKNAGISPDFNLQNLQKNSNFRKLPFAKKACIFLKEGKCSVYSHRPMVCRLHNIAKGQNTSQCIVDETGHTAIANKQMFIVETQAMMLYIIKKGLDGLKPIYEYEF